jgi:hypothetical protein
MNFPLRTSFCHLVRRVESLATGICNTPQVIGTFNPGTTKNSLSRSWSGSLRPVR